MVASVNKKTLLIATDSFLPRWDGIARFLNEIVPYVAKHFDVVVVAPKYPGILHGFENVTIIRIPVQKWKIADINPAKFRFDQIKKLVANSDIIWTQSIGPIGALAMYYARNQKKPLVSFVHSVEWFLFSKSLKHGKVFVEFLIRKMIPFLYNKCDVMILPFEGMIPMMRAEGIISKMEVIYLGVDTKKFFPAISRSEAKAKLGLSPNSVVIGYLGRFGREKNIPTLYEAFRKLRSEKMNVSLLIVGGNLKQPFEDMSDVKVFSSVNNPVDYYHAMDVYVLPSLTETTSLTTMEAMACGLPVVVTPVGYIVKYVEHKFNGFIFPVQNSERLYILLRKLVNDSVLRREIGKNARNTIIHKHSWENAANSLVDILKRF